ncbi:hypothetical protein BpHYR1_008437 [Brachionus plicatilis]|uniref:Uncharacterized protein n=1 Tax=Brachionus plicatilis TaxID=10195 RepID=A0A3M7SB67_BRAPC|nr:hypothetical protein BpHYR1_008437 [Brachionus plicatilis]
MSFFFNLGAMTIKSLKNYFTFNDYTSPMIADMSEIGHETNSPAIHFVNDTGNSARLISQQKQNYNLGYLFWPLFAEK